MMHVGMVAVAVVRHAPVLDLHLRSPQDPPEAGAWLQFRNKMQPTQWVSAQHFLAN